MLDVGFYIRATPTSAVFKLTALGTNIISYIAVVVVKITSLALRQTSNTPLQILLKRANDLHLSQDPFPCSGLVKGLTMPRLVEPNSPQYITL